MKRRTPSILILVIVGLFSSAEVMVAQLVIGEMRTKVEELRSDLDEPIEVLNKQYEKELTDLKLKAKEGGDIDLAIAASTELSSFRSGNSKPASDPDLKRLQDIYKEHSLRLRQERNTKDINLLKSYKLQLAEAIERHAKSGDGAAIQAIRRETDLVDLEIKSLESGAAWRELGATGVVTPRPVEPPSSPVFSLRPRTAPASDEIVRLEQDLKKSTEQYEPGHPLLISAEERLEAAYLKAGLIENAVPLMARKFARNPGDGNLATKVATMQIWFGLEEDYLASRESFIAWVEGASRWRSTFDEALAYFILARMINIHPSDSPEMRKLAKEKAERAVVLLKDHITHPGYEGRKLWYRLDVSIADFRQGNYQRAESSLSEIEADASDYKYVTRIAGSFRAMCLFKMGKRLDALKLFQVVEGKVELPENDSNPIAGNPHDDQLVCWLAFREAKALIRP